MSGETGKEQGLIRDFVSGDKSAFDALVIMHKDAVFNLCYRFMGSYEDADDCAQEVFVKVYRSLHKFRFESSFSTWLYRIAVNTCKNKVAAVDYRQSRANLKLDAPGNADDNDCPLQVNDGLSPPDDDLQKKETEGIIQKALASLSEEFKKIVVLRDVEGLSYDDIAAVTGCGLGTVKSKLSRARQELRKKLKGLL